MLEVQLPREGAVVRQEPVGAEHELVDHGLGGHVRERRLDQALDQREGALLAEVRELKDLVAGELGEDA